MKRERESQSEAVSKNRSGHERIRTGLGADAIAEALIDNLHFLQAKVATVCDAQRLVHGACLYGSRPHAGPLYQDGWKRSPAQIPPCKFVAYLSAEFLTGPHLGNSLINLGIWQAAQEAVARVGQNLSDLLEQEEEPGLGNGGLGRLAACYMDSLATLNVPAIGYGIRYEFGIFDQAIRDGWQVELTDKWLRFGNPWEIVRSEITFDVKFGGRTEHYRDDRRAAIGCAGFRRRWSRASPTTRPCPATGCPPPTCCACGRRKPPNRSISKRSMSATTTARWTRRSRRKRSPRCSIRTTSPKRESELRLAAAVLLRLLLAAGHDPPASDARARSWTSSIRTGPRS